MVLQVSKTPETEDNFQGKGEYMNLTSNKKFCIVFAAIIYGSIPVAILLLPSLPI